VTLGGGTGQGQLLRGLARRGVELTGLVGVTDNGGHSGHLRKLLGIPAVGDLRGCISAVSEPGPFRSALNFRFSAGELDGASLGNLLLSGLVLSEGSLSRAAAVLSSRTGASARILPVSDGSSQIAAELSDSRTITGEWEVIRREPRTPITRLYHDPPLVATEEAIRAAKRADLVVIGPGSLRTALVSILLTKGLRETLMKKRVAYVLNILTQAGQTDGFTAGDHVEEISRYLGRPPDFVIANSKRPPDWAMEGAEFVDPAGIAAIRANLLEPVRPADTARRARPSRFPAGPHLVRHDPTKLARAVLKLIANR